MTIIIQTNTLQSPSRKKKPSKVNSQARSHIQCHWFLVGSRDFDCHIWESLRPIWLVPLLVWDRKKKALSRLHMNMKKHWASYLFDQNKAGVWHKMIASYINFMHFVGQSPWKIIDLADLASSFNPAKKSVLWWPLKNTYQEFDIRCIRCNRQRENCMKTVSWSETLLGNIIMFNTLISWVNWGLCLSQFPWGFTFPGANIAPENGWLEG